MEEGLRGFLFMDTIRDTEHYSDRIEGIRYINIKNVRIINVYIYNLPLRGVGLYNLEAYNVIDGYKQPYNSYISMYATSPNTGELTSYYSVMKIQGKSTSPEKMKVVFMFFQALLVGNLNPKTVRK